MLLFIWLNIHSCVHVEGMCLGGTVWESFGGELCVGNLRLGELCGEQTQPDQMKSVSQ